MKLSNDIISQFVKITNDDKKSSSSSSAYGKVVVHDGITYVQLDGSDLLTPVDSTVSVKNEERVQVTIKDHVATIDGNITDVSASNQHLLEVENDLASFKVTTEGMFVTVRDEFNTKFSEFQVMADNITARVSNVEGDVSQLKITANEIRTEVSKKVDGDQVGTIVTQNAESWGLSINGKLYGTNYRFDGTNFSIGSTNGNTTAYHAPGYSKWTHSDGSWTQIDPYGLSWSNGSTSTGYHRLLYAGEYICRSEETVTITLPSEFRGKPFKVVTSIKRIYVALLDYIENCRFPLLSFYAEARNIDQTNGTINIYASVRAWNRTGVSGIGTVVGTNTSEKDSNALKPVVAYWVFV